MQFFCEATNACIYWSERCFFTKIHQTEKACQSYHRFQVLEINVVTWRLIFEIMKMLVVSGEWPRLVDGDHTSSRLASACARPPLAPPSNAVRSRRSALGDATFIYTIGIRRQWRRGSRAASGWSFANCNERRSKLADFTAFYAISRLFDDIAARAIWREYTLESGRGNVPIISRYFRREVAGVSGYLRLFARICGKKIIFYFMRSEADDSRRGQLKSMPLLRSLNNCLNYFYRDVAPTALTIMRAGGLRLRTRL